MSEFYVCACDLTGECHAMRESTNHCDLCDGPQVATQENVDKMFKGYQSRYQALIARLENPDEALVEAVMGAMPVQIEQRLIGSTMHVEVIDRRSPKFVTPESVIAALAATLKESPDDQT